MQALLPVFHIAIAAILFVAIVHGLPLLADALMQPRQLGKQRGMVLLGKSYKGYAAGTIVQLATQEEAALIAQGYATTSAGPVTPGAVTTTASAGRVAVAAAASSVVITNPNIDANSKVWAVVNQAAADGTALRVERIVPAAGSVTIYLTAAATAQTNIDWMLMMVSGELPPQA